MANRIKLKHDPTEKVLPWTAEVHIGVGPTGVRGYGATKDEAAQDAREKWAARDKREPDEWVDL